MMWRVGGVFAKESRWTLKCDQRGNRLGILWWFPSHRRMHTFLSLNAPVRWPNRLYIRFLMIAWCCWLAQFKLRFLTFFALFFPELTLLVLGKVTDRIKLVFLFNSLMLRRSLAYDRRGELFCAHNEKSSGCCDFSFFFCAAFVKEKTFRFSHHHFYPEN